jgi:YidC/Oxa1 family membrane protein insertase
VTPVVAAGFLGIEHFTPPWDVFFLPLFNLLVLAYRVLFSDFALAIIVFTIVIRTILAPLFVRQIKSQKEMQRMQPLVREIQRKHKGNRQKITEETMALYREHGVNQFGGCLPVLLQLPILFALYQALIRASGVVQNFIPDSGNQTAFDALQSADVISPIQGLANHYQVIPDGACNLDAYERLPQFLPLNCQLIDTLKLSAPVDTTIGWLGNLDLAAIDNVFAISLFGGFSLSLLAVIAAALQFVQVRMTTPKAGSDDPTASTQATMTYLFPLLTIFWGGLFPSGLILYWIVYTGYLVVQQFIIMGWGNLFPLFGWQPGFAPRPETGISSAPKRPKQEPRATGEPATEVAASVPSISPNRPVGTGSQRGQQRPANRRPGTQKRRGRKR